VLLTLGLLTTVATGWCAYLAQNTEPPWRTVTSNMYEPWLAGRGLMPQVRLQFPQGEAMIEWTASPGQQSVTVTPTWGQGVPSPLPAQWFAIYKRPSEVPAEEAAAFPIRDYSLPFWARVPPSDTKARNLVTTVCGWPMPALLMTDEIRVTPPTSNTRMVVQHLPSWAWTIPEKLGYPQRWLPLRPIAVGFLVDTLFYAALFLLGVTGVRSARRWDRSRKGLCWACAYSRAGLSSGAPCPECGSP